MTLSSRKEFNAVLLEAIDEGLEAALGESGKQVIYYHLRNSKGLGRESIPENPEAFTEFLNSFFGRGAQLIEKIIMERLCRKLEIQHEATENTTLTDFIRKIRQQE